MPSSSSTQNSEAPPLPTVDLTLKKHVGENNGPFNYGPFSPLVAEVRVLANCVQVADNAQSSTQAQPTCKPTIMYPALNSCGLIVIEETDGEALQPPAPPQFLPSPPPPAMVDFVVKSADQSDPGVRYHMARTGPFFSVYNDYAEKLGYTGIDIKLRRDEDLVSPLETPDDIDMEDGEALIASPVRGKMNMDTRYKVFTIRACVLRSLKLRFKARQRTSLQTVTKMWCDFSHMDLAKLVLLRENTPVPQFGNAGQSPIKNEDVVFAFTLN